jgi:hypothetical protein
LLTSNDFKFRNCFDNFCLDHLDGLDHLDVFDLLDVVDLLDAVADHEGDELLVVDLAILVRVDLRKDLKETKTLENKISVFIFMFFDNALSC